MPVLRWQRMFFLLSFITIVVIIVCDKLLGTSKRTIRKPSIMLVQHNDYVQAVRNKSEALQRFYDQIEKARAKVSESIGKTRSCDDDSELTLHVSQVDYFEKFKLEIPDANVVFFDTNMAAISRDVGTVSYASTSNDCPILEHNVMKEADFMDKTMCTNHLQDQKINFTWSEMADFPLTSQQTTHSVNKNFTFLHMIPNAWIDANGDVMSNKVKVIPDHCQLRTHPGIFSMLLTWIAEMFSKYPTEYDEVFSIAQVWDADFHHSTMEDLPRLALYLPFFHDNPQMKILANSKHKFLPLLGLDPARFISGRVRAKILYLPAGSRCDVLPVIGGQILSSALQVPVSKENHRRDLLVLIKRSNVPQFSHHGAIYNMMSQYARRFSLNAVVFDDNPLPDVNQTMEIFYRALIVVAPHGAGEANMLFSQPGTVLIEGLCHDQHKLVNLRYQRAAKTLRFRYHGIVFPHKQCMDITANDAEIPLAKYLELLGYYTKQ